jgi:hypothetical protein
MAFIIFVRIEPIDFFTGKYGSSQYARLRNLSLAAEIEAVPGGWFLLNLCAELPVVFLEDTSTEKSVRVSETVDKEAPIQVVP